MGAALYHGYNHLHTEAKPAWSQYWKLFEGMGCPLTQWSILRLTNLSDFLGVFAKLASLGKRSPFLITNGDIHYYGFGEINEMNMVHTQCRISFISLKL